MHTSTTSFRRIWWLPDKGRQLLFEMESKIILELFFYKEDSNELYTFGTLILSENKISNESDNEELVIRKDDTK
eukprot:5833261-Ditylum_brightwellii.AAC.1